MSTRSRRAAREAALAVLYGVEIGREKLDHVWEHLEAAKDLPPRQREYADRLVRGVLADRRMLDDRIGIHLEGWELSRLAVIDRILLRIGTFELFFVEDVPPKVVLDEAIELAKKYSTAESGRFVNGVLAAILPESPKAQWSAPEGAEVEEPGPIEDEPEPVVVSEDAPEAKEWAKVGKWKLRSGRKTA